ncbi:TPPP3 [Branchiostoma lanceolatum]|uniref:TPPP3 protein n=1 Tax=Branchiostoma lanceolatum TaxID=7740 RepID=A0A8K0A7A8_BRALA|nr:TPPP3 [Branchiostoma lanceolatum]
MKPSDKRSKTGGVDRVTDTSQYTGSHKKRFDETGKGKGIEVNEGYVAPSLVQAMSEAMSEWTAKAGGVDCRTDTSKDTGSPKERFAVETGKGKEGREDLADDPGDVGAYKGEERADNPDDPGDVGAYKGEERADNPDDPGDVGAYKGEERADNPDDPGDVGAYKGEST